jgi:predicted PurR-regulated permease PerM
MRAHPDAPEPGIFEERHDRHARGLLLLAFGLALALIAAWFVRHALFLIYVSAVFAVVLKPAVDRLHRTPLFGWHPGRGSALLLLVVLLVLFLGGIIAIAVPSILANMAGFVDSLVKQFRSLQSRFESIPVLRSLDLSNLQSHISAALAQVLPAVSGALAATLTSVLLTAYFILDGGALLKRALRTVPPQSRTRLEITLNRAAARMRHWLVGQAILMAILGVSSTITFGLMGLPYFYLLGLFAGLANIVPLLGPLVTVVVASAVAATQSGWDVLGVVVFYLAYQQVENAFLTPKIMKSQVQLPSAVVIVALLVGSELAGAAGALVAVPSAVIVAELANEYLSYGAPPEAPSKYCAESEPSIRQPE